MSTNRAEERVLLAGGSGLVGSRALASWLARGGDARVTALVRRPLPLSDPRVEQKVVDFTCLANEIAVPARAALCALGTTMKAAGSQAAFRAVDHDAVLAFARWSRDAGVPTFVLVSSVGADPSARNFYLRVKGEAEEGIAALGFPRFVALRPSVLLGPRDESRPGEALARRMMPLVNPVLVGPARRYRGISADQVAAAVVRAALDRAPGRFVWEHDDLRRAAAAT